MKRQMIFSAIFLSSLLVLGEPVGIQAAEMNGAFDDAHTNDKNDLPSSLDIFSFDADDFSDTYEGSDAFNTHSGSASGTHSGGDAFSTYNGSDVLDFYGIRDALGVQEKSGAGSGSGSGAFGAGSVSEGSGASGAGSISESNEASGAESISDSSSRSIMDDKADFLTAGIGDLFISPLTKVEYVEIAKKAEGALWGYTHLGICNVEENNLNIRQEPDESGKLVGKLPKNAACEIVSSGDGWAYITSGKVSGYVKEEYLLTGFEAKMKGEELASAIAVSIADGLNIREEPNTEAEIVTQVASGEILDILEIQDDGWIKVYLDDEEVYVSGDYVEVKSDLNTAITMTELMYGQGVSDVRVDLCQYAKQFLGNPYVWGGTSLTRGADCSGFVLSVFAKYGVSLPHSSRAQAGMGTGISASQLQPGDLVFYAKGGVINHVAIYIGSGQVIHASSPKTGIKISGYNYRTPSKMVRILHD